jgi:hypothetical protein
LKGETAVEAEHHRQTEEENKKEEQDGAGDRNESKIKQSRSIKWGS